MILSPRAVLWALLINAVPVAMFALMGALIWFNAWAFAISPVTAVKIAVGVVPTVLVLGRGLWVLFSKSDDSVRGSPVREQEQPELWALVRRLAEVADTAPPDDIHLVAEANASVREDTRLLGLLSARRHMFIGAPLVAAMSSAQLAAVLTHELAHYGNRDTRFAGLAYRSRSAFTRTLATINRGDRLQLGLHFLLRHYGAFVFRASAKLSRRQESVADEAAAIAVGSAATASAFRELAPIAESWDIFENNHLVIGWDAGYLPADVFAGYRKLHASLHEPLQGLRTDPPDAADPFDSHPPLRDRIAAIDALGAVGTIHVPATQALGLLRDPLRLLDAAVLADLTPEARSKRRADWPTLIRISGISSLTENTDRVLARAAQVTGGPPTLRTLLDALDAGRLIELGADPSQAANPSDGPRVLRERSRLIVHKALFGAVATALTSSGALHWTESWPSVGAMRLDERFPDPLPNLIDAAVADPPDTSRLRALLDSVRDSPGRSGRHGAVAR